MKGRFGQNWLELVRRFGLSCQAGCANRANSLSLSLSARSGGAQGRRFSRARGGGAQNSPVLSVNRSNIIILLGARYGFLPH
ncbi:MAG: hypothetical protein LBE03_01020 [Candidatus Nomurabacteria bacterium]|nr:hypothetical protein [Candidatus Nomurabacteria bacterium]